MRLKPLSMPAPVFFNRLSIYRLLNVVLILVLAGFSWNRSQYEPPGILKIMIVDEATGNPVPARLEVLDDEGQGQIADDALLVGSQHPGTYTKATTKNENSGKELFLQREGWNLEFIGTLEEWKEGLNRTAGRAGEFAHQFYSQGSSTLSVKPGRYRIRVLKGFEYSVAKQQVTVRSAETTETTVRLKRWINMSDKDWYSADAHIHIGRQFKELDGALCQWMQAEDVRVSPNVTKTQAVYASAVAIRWYVRRVSLLFIKRSLIAPLGRTSTAARFRRTKRKV